MSELNPVQKLVTFGQSPWLDFISRSFLRSGGLQKLVDAGEVVGVTSNPAIFEQAISGSSDYDGDIAVMAGENMSAEEIYDALSIQDVQEAADILRDVYDLTNGLDGYVSLEVSPHIAHDTKKTIAEGKRLWERIDRPNVMIKVPATKEGIPAVKALLEEGINVNITLLFSVKRYEEIAKAYVASMKTRAAKGLPLDVASVASFFVSRVDTLVDPILEKHENPLAKELLGMVAIANSCMAYRDFEGIFIDKEFQKLHEQGASVQRLLWASTSTKNPAYSKVMYVDGLVGPSTVNTMPLQTIEDYRELGDPEDRISGTALDAEVTLERLKEFGLDIEEVAAQLEKEGVAKFVEPFDKLLASIEAKREAILVR